MLENTPTQSTMTELLGQPLFAVWQELCSAIDEKYDMERLWNTGGKNWVYEYKYRRGGKTLCSLYAKKNSLGFMIIFKTFDVTNLIKVSRKRSLKFNMLLDYCIGRAAVKVKEFYILPVGEKLMQYDTIAVNTIVKNKEGEVSSCDLSYKAELNQFNEEYLKYTAQVAASCQDRDLSENSMVIGTSAIIDTEIDGAVGMNSGIFNNPFII